MDAIKRLFAPAPPMEELHYAVPRPPRPVTITAVRPRTFPNSQEVMGWYLTIHDEQEGVDYLTFAAHVGGNHIIKPEPLAGWRGTMNFSPFAYGGPTFDFIVSTYGLWLPEH
jgi:hypothetical protein